jgi:hypothetical protein
VLLEKWLSACRKLKLDPCLSSCTSINPKQIQNLNIRPKIELSVGKSREYSGSNRIAKEFLNITPAAQHLRENMDKWDYMNLKSFCTTKKNGF